MTKKIVFNGWSISVTIVDGLKVLKASPFVYTRVFGQILFVSIHLASKVKKVYPK